VLRNCWLVDTGVVRTVFRIVVSVNQTLWREATTPRRYALCFQEIVSEDALAHHNAEINFFFLKSFRPDIQHAAVTVALFRPKTDHPNIASGPAA
jgi:hypothetical protein